MAGDDDLRGALGDLKVQYARMDQKIDDMLRRQQHTEALLSGTGFVTRSEFNALAERTSSMEGYWKRIVLTGATIIIAALLGTILVKTGVPN